MDGGAFVFLSPLRVPCYYPLPALLPWSPVLLLPLVTRLGSTDAGSRVFVTSRVLAYAIVLADISLLLHGFAACAAQRHCRASAARFAAAPPLRATAAALPTPVFRWTFTGGLNSTSL